MILVDMSRSAYCRMTAWLWGCGIASVADGRKRKLIEAGTSTMRCAKRYIFSLEIGIANTQVYRVRVEVLPTWFTQINVARLALAIHLYVTYLLSEPKTVHINRKCLTTSTQFNNGPPLPPHSFLRNQRPVMACPSAPRSRYIPANTTSGFRNTSAKRSKQSSPSCGRSTSP